MDAAGHLAAAEDLTAKASTDSRGVPGLVDHDAAVLALIHAVMAVAIELGVPHSTDSTGAGSHG